MHANNQMRRLLVFLCIVLFPHPTPQLGAQEEVEREDTTKASDQSPERYGGMTRADGIYLPNATEIFGDSKTTALVQALWRADAKAAHELIDSGADINAGGRRGVTPLQFLVLYEKIEGIELALELGADPNQASDGGDMALSYAMGTADWRRLLKMLVNAGADVKKASNSSRFQGRHSIEKRVIIRLMEEHRAAAPGEEAFPSTTAERPGFELLWWLLEHGGDANAMDS